MTTTTATEQGSTTPSGSQLLALALSAVVLLACLGAAGYWVYAFVAGADASGSGRVVGTEDPPTQHVNTNWAMQARASQLGEPDGVHDRRGTVYVKAGRYRMNVIKQPKGDPRLMVLPVVAESLVTPEQAELRDMRGRILADAKVAEFLKITPDQKKKLAALPGSRGMAITPEEEAQLQALWKTYSTAQGAAKAAPQTQMIELLKTAAPKSLPATKSALADRTQAIKDILTKDQIEAFRNMGK